MSSQEEEELRELCLDMLTMLIDLSDLYDWNELHRQLDDVVAQAAEMGIINED